MFFQITKSWIVFQDFIRILKWFKFDMLYNSTLMMKSIHDENQTFNMNVPLSYNMFKVRESIGYKKRSSFLYLNHILTLKNLSFNFLTRQSTTLAIQINPHWIPKSNACDCDQWKFNYELQKWKRFGWRKLPSQFASMWYSHNIYIPSHKSCYTTFQT